MFAYHGYRTGLGTAFYDRVDELGQLDRLVQGYRLVVVYGPRSVGESELARHWGRRRAGRHGYRLTVFQADLAGAERVAEGLEVYLVPAGERQGRHYSRSWRGVRSVSAC